MGLQDDLAGVNPSVSPTESESQKDDITPDPVAGNPGSTDDDLIGDRPVRNLQREFDRKMENQERNFRQQLTDMGTRIVAELKTAAPAPAPPPAPAPAPGPSATESEPVETKPYTTATLQKMLRNPAINTKQKDVIDKAIAARTGSPAPTQQAAPVDDLRAVVRDVVSEDTRNRRAQDFDRNSRQEAMDRFPALADKESEFFRAVSTELDSIRDYRGQTSGDVLDAANRVAGELGVSARQTPGRSFVAPGGTRRPHVTEDEPGEFALTSESFDDVAHGLRNAMPIKEGKRVEFNKKQIMADSKEIDRNAHLFGIPKGRR